MMIRLPLLAAASISTASSLPIGTWNASLSGLPTNTLPDSPLLGNGYLGIMLTDQPWAVPFATSNGARGPSDDSVKSTHYFINTNGHWTIQPAQHGDTLGPTSTATKVGLGGLTISSSIMTKDGDSKFEAQQIIENATIVDKHISECGTLMAISNMHPTENVMVFNTTWIPGATACDSSNMTLKFSTWTFSQMQTQGG